ncbi:Chaperone protein DnaK [Minicystis rosea]|nr:Chaperone protein DnaK [Minicystis rosea]
MEGREAKVVPNQEGSRLTPSVVAWDERGEVLVGQIAKRQAVVNPTGTIYSAKRFIGRRYDEVTDEIKRVPFAVVKAPNGDAVFEVGGKTISPQQVSSHVLTKLKKAAEERAQSRQARLFEEGRVEPVRFVSPCPERRLARMDPPETILRLPVPERHPRGRGIDVTLRVPMVGARGACAAKEVFRCLRI